MAKIDRCIEIVSSNQARLSSMSRVSRDAVMTVLSKYYADVRITMVDNLSDLDALVARKPDLVFLGMYFIPENLNVDLDDSAKIWIASYLDMHGLAYTGSNQSAHELDSNKSLAKQCALDAGLQTSPFQIVRQNQSLLANDIILTFPLFVKPSDRGGGLGIDSRSVVHNFSQLLSKVQSISANHQSDSIVEEYLPGREFSVAILKEEHSLEFSVMPIELIAPADYDGVRILSAAVKSADTESNIELTDKLIKAAVNELAIDVFHALGARDYGRIDIRLNKTGTPQFLETNLIPSLINNYGNFPKACMLNIGLEYEPMILHIVRLALARCLKFSEAITEAKPVSSPLLPALVTALKPV